jgi:uncharacterized membrane protein
MEGPMTERSIAERAERLSAQRARMLPVLALLYFAQQMSFFSGEVGHRTVDHFKIGAWVVLSLVLILALMTKGFWLHRREVRELVDDENTRANRNDATRIGFFAGMLAAIVGYFIPEFEPWTAQDSAHLVLTFGIGAALIRFAFLERRAHRNG